MPKTYVKLQDRSLRNMRIVNDYISGESIIKISREYSLTYDRTRTILKEHNMRQYFVVDYADDFVLYEGTLENCEEILQQNYAGLMLVGYRDLTSGMVSSLKQFRSKNKEQI